MFFFGRNKVTWKLSAKMVLLCFCRSGEHSWCNSRLYRRLCGRVPTANISHLVLCVSLHCCRLVRWSCCLFDIC